MKKTIKFLNLDDEYFTPERCFITEVSNSKDDPGLSIARARVEPGVTTQWHRLQDTAERYCIVSGSGQVEIGDCKSETVNPGDVVLIPPDVRQRITNTGPEDLVFLAICTPRFSEDRYENLEE
jgi:mannose-6-phosphate isomerase-like protein (cupin superfamily)